MAGRSSGRDSAGKRSKPEQGASATSAETRPIHLGLADDLERNERFRERYIRRTAASEVAGEIRSLRKRRSLRQQELAARAKTGQSAISRIESQDYDGWNFQTLVTIAVALGARVRFKLEPIEDVIERFRAHERAVAAGDEGSEPQSAHGALTLIVRDDDGGDETISDATEQSGTIYSTNVH